MPCHHSPGAPTCPTEEVPPGASPGVPQRANPSAQASAQTGSQTGVQRYYFFTFLLKKKYFNLFQHRLIWNLYLIQILPLL